MIVASFCDKKDEPTDMAIRGVGLTMKTLSYIRIKYPAKISWRKGQSNIWFNDVFSVILLLESPCLFICSSRFFTHHSIVWCVQCECTKWHGGRQGDMVFDMEVDNVADMVVINVNLGHTAWAKTKSGRAKSRPKFGDPWSDRTGGPGFGGVQGPVSGPNRPLEF